MTPTEAIRTIETYREMVLPPLRDAIDIALATLRKQARVPPVSPLRWECDPSVSGYVRLTECDDLFQNDGDPDPRIGFARRLRATADDLDAAALRERPSSAPESRPICMSPTD